MQNAITGKIVDSVALAVLTGSRFYYADERTATGDVAGGKIDGEAHGEFYYELASAKTQGPWLGTFVKGKGYVEFSTSQL